MVKICNHLRNKYENIFKNKSKRIMSKLTMHKIIQEPLQQRNKTTH